MPWRLVIGGVVLVGAGIYGAVTSADRGEDGQITGAGALTVEQIEVGDCLGATGEGEFNQVDAIPCTEPHAEEVFHVADLALGADAVFPGEDRTFEMGAEMCFGAFEGYVGQTYEQSALDFTVAIPTTEGWGAGEREIICFLFDPAGTTTGSLRGSGR